jgi:hypothetical protein
MVPVAIASNKALELESLKYWIKMKDLSATQYFWCWWHIIRGKGSANRVIPV